MRDTENDRESVPDGFGVPLVSHAMGCSASWHTLIERLDGLPEGATLRTPLSHDRFRISDVQEQRVVMSMLIPSRRSRTGTTGSNADQ
jgi:hypothetical protein